MRIRSSVTAARLGCATGVLESALYRPQTGYYADLVEEAAALWESLAQNHPFIDANKRTAFAATYTFLAINGARLTANAEDAYAFVSGLHEEGEFRFDEDRCRGCGATSILALELSKSGLRVVTQ